MTDTRLDAPSEDAATEYSNYAWEASLIAVLCYFIPIVFVPLFIIRALRRKHKWAVVVPGLTIGTIQLLLSFVWIALRYYWF